jgi:hypothetical protein
MLLTRLQPLSQSHTARQRLRRSAKLPFTAIKLTSVWPQCYRRSDRPSEFSLLVIAQLCQCWYRSWCPHPLSFRSFLVSIACMRQRQSLCIVAVPASLGHFFPSKPWTRLARHAFSNNPLPTYSISSTTGIHSSLDLSTILIRPGRRYRRRGA